MLINTFIFFINQSIIYSPLDIFELTQLPNCTSIGSFLPVFTNLNIFFILGIILIIVILKITTTKLIYVKCSKIIILIVIFTTFIKNIIREIIDSEQNIHYILFISLGLILFGFNLLGLLPYSLSVTSYFSVTFTLSFIFFISFNIIGAITHQDKIVLLWLPQGTPYIVTPFIILIEIISYLTRMFSLAIRLFANIMSGHTLLKILSGFAWSLLISGGILTYFSLFPFVIIFLISGLEFAIAFLQAYVFLVLLVVYLNDALNLH
jgi:F-type H+-transporting ATPase subunit a